MGISGLNIDMIMNLLHKFLNTTRVAVASIHCSNFWEEQNFVHLCQPVFSVQHDTSRQHCTTPICINLVKALEGYN